MMQSCLLILCLALQSEAVFVEAGQAKLVRVEGEAWKTVGGFLAGGGTGNYLYAAKDIGKGDFRFSAKLAIEGLAGSAASFVIGGESHFGFCGRSGKMFVEGPLFGRGARNVGDPAEFIAEGKSFTFEAARKGKTLTFKIDGKEVYNATVGDDALGPVGFRPWRSRMRIERFAATGQLVAAEDTSGPEGQVDVFASGAGGYHTYRIPSVIVTKKGTLLAFCEGRKGGRGDSGNIDMVLRRSFDGGKTWGPLQTVWNDAGNTCGNCCPVVDASTGTIWLLLTWNRGDDHERDIIAGRSKDVRRPYVSRSTDDGAMWSKPVDLSKTCRDPEWGWYATGPGVAIQLKRGPHKGRLVCPANHSNQKYPIHAYGSHVIFSDDGGKTWRRSETIRPGCNESQVVELADGKLMMNMRSYTPKGRRAVAISSNGGETWGKVRHDDALPEPTCQASFLRYTTVDDGGKNRLLFSNPPTTKGRVRMTVKLSTDEGETWPVSRLIYKGSSAYSCLTALPDRSIGLLYERDGYKKITFARFSLEWLTEGKDRIGK